MPDNLPLPDDLITEVIRHGLVERTVYLRKNSSDLKVYNEIFRVGIYDLNILPRWEELATYLFAEQKAKRQALIVDAGANIGLASLYLDQKMHNFRFVAIEPDPSNFALLQENTKGLNCTCVQAALTGSGAPVKVVDPGLGFWGLRTEASDDGQGVPSVTINQIYKQYCSDTVRPFMVKIDIEGAEGEVFSSNLEWIEQTPLIAIELHDWLLPRQGTAAKVFRALADHPFDFDVFKNTLAAIRYDIG